MKLKSLIFSAAMTLSALSFGQHGPADTTATGEERVESNVQIFAPNAFTPDGDFYNDTWKVYAEGIDLYNFHLTIFDRTGQVIWESFDVTGEWDGTYGGNTAPDGIYVYRIETKDIETDQRFETTGFITILR